MKAYELSVVAKTGSDEEIKNTIKTIEETLQKLETTISQITEPSKVKLGYVIKKQKEGILTSFYFQAEPKALEALKKEVDAIPELLRYFLAEKKKVRKQPQYRTRAPQITEEISAVATATEEIDEAPAPAKEEVKETPVKETKEKPEKRRKAELEDINKELEEMLK